MSEPKRRRKKNRSYALYADTVDYVVSQLEAPAPACAAWISRRYLADGIPVHRGKWFARRWTLEELHVLRPVLEKAGLPIPDDLSSLIQECEMGH